MAEKDLLEGKRILLVDDEPDVLDTLEDLLPMCETVKASNFNAAKDYLESEHFDMAVLDIMGVEGYDLLEIAINSIQHNISCLIKVVSHVSMFPRCIAKP